MADNESIGGVSISITGDAGPLQASFAAAQSSASAAGARVASAFNEGAGATDQMANAAVRAAAAEAGFESVTTRTNIALRTQVSEMQAVSGTLRTLDGNQGIRAAERFLTLIPGLAPALQAAFPIIGAIALGEVIARAVEHFEKLAKGAGDAAEAVQRAFREINLGAKESNDSLQVANDRLENEIAKIEKKPENGIKLALDEAILSADQLGKSLDTDLGKLTKLLTEQKTGLVAQIFGQASTSDIEAEVQQFQDRVAKVTASSKIPRQESFGGVSIFGGDVLEQQKTAEQTRVNTELTNIYSAELQKLQHELKTAYGAGADGAVDNTRRVELLTAAITNLREQARSIDLKSINANLQGDKGQAEGAAEATRQAERQAEIARQALNKRVEIFEQEKRTAEELRRAQIEGQDELNRAAQKLYDTNRRAADEAENAARKMGLTSNELANKSSQLLSGVKPETGEKNEAVNQQALQALQGGNAVQQQLALAIQLKQVGIETTNEVQSRIGNLQQELAAAERLNVPIAERLKLEKAIAEAKHKQFVGGQIGQIGEQGLASVSSAIAKGVFEGGKGLGKDLRESLKGIGEQLFSTLLKDSVDQLIIAITGQTIATNLNTIWLAIKSVIPFAEGTSSAPGGMALIGEKGPEIMYVPRGAQITPNHAITKYASGTPGYARLSASSASSVSIGAVHLYAGNHPNPRRLAEQMFDEIPKVAKARSPEFSPYSK